MSHLPAAVVEALKLKEGDDIEFSVASRREFKVERSRTRQDAIDRLSASIWKLPSGFKFDREEANER